MRATQQVKIGSISQLHGKAELHYSSYILYADDITYDSDTGDSIEDGHVILDGGPNDEHIRATHSAYNVRSESGRFENVVGTIGMKLKGNRFILTSPNPFAFSGKVVLKPGPDHYVVYNGTITTCQLPKPKWQFWAHRMSVEVGGNAKLYNSVFSLDGIPVWYFPFATHPVEREPRQTGFLIPSIGRSSTNGDSAGEAVFWAINRSLDARIGSEYFSKRGWAPDGELRARPSSGSFLDLNFFSVLDRRTGVAYEGGAEARLLGEGTLDNRFRSVVDVDYLTSYVFRLAFSDSFSQAVNSEVKSWAFLSSNNNGLLSSASMQRYQNYETDTAPPEVVTILHAPSFESMSVDRELGDSPFYWSYDAAAEGLSRSQPALGDLPAFRTAPLVARFDLQPDLSLAWKADGWSFRPELALRETLYTQQLVPAGFGAIGIAKSSVITRKALEGSFEVRPPTLARVFDRELLGRKWKHVIEPGAAYHYVAGVNNFSHILRFDERDILTDTNEIDYSLINRFYAKRTRGKSEDCGAPGMPSLAVGGAPPSQITNRVPWERPPQKAFTCTAEPDVREVITWQLEQKYFLNETFGGALVPGIRNVFSTTEDLTGIAFLNDPRRLSPLISRLRIETSSRSNIEYDVDYDFFYGRINTSTAFLNYQIGPFTIGGGDAYLHVPGETSISAPTPQPLPPPTTSFASLWATVSRKKEASAEPPP
jgi:LPS-assembly protein